MADELGIALARLETLLEGAARDIASIKATIGPWGERLATLEQKTEDSRKNNEYTLAEINKTLTKFAEWRQDAEPRVASLTTGIRVVATIFLTTVGLLGGAVGWLLKTVSENDRMGRIHEVQIKALEQRLENKK